LYGLLAIGLFLGLRLLDEWRANHRLSLASLRPGIVVLVTCAIVALGGLWLLDSQFSTYASPIDHIRRIVEYGANLRGPVVQTGICPGADSGPLQWIFNQCQITYVRVDVTVRAGEEIVSSVPSVDFRGALNPLLPNMMLIATLFTGWYAWRTGSVLARWSVVWIAANYLPYVAIALVSDRIMYLYYFLPVVPGVAAVIALFLARGGLPRQADLAAAGALRRHAAAGGAAATAGAGGAGGGSGGWASCVATSTTADESLAGRTGKITVGSSV